MKQHVFNRTKRQLTGISISAGLLVASIVSVVLADENKVPYPETYRNWMHVKTMLIEPGHPLENPFQGIHHIYANEKAVKGLKSGNYADGSTIVFDLLAYMQKDKTIQEGNRKLIGVMYRDSKKYLETGGWGFEGFAKNSKTERLVKDGGTSCFACHSPQKDKEFVFSEFRD
jgi:hypothetical protein